MTNEELVDFLSRPRRPAHELPDYTPMGPLERVLHQVHESADDRLAEFHRDLLMHVLHVAIVPEAGNTVEGVKYEGAAWHPFVRDDGKMLLFSSLGRAYDGLPKPDFTLPPPYPLQPLVPLVAGHGFEVLPDLLDYDLILNPFSRHSWRLPRQEVAELLRTHVVRKPPLTSAADLPTQELRPVEWLPEGLGDCLRSLCWEQRPAAIQLAYVAEWNLPPDHPDAGLAVFALTRNLDTDLPLYLPPIAAGARLSPPVRLFYLDPQLFTTALPRVAEQLRNFDHFFLRDYERRPPFF